MGRGSGHTTSANGLATGARRLNRQRIPDHALLVEAIDFTTMTGDDHAPVVSLPKAISQLIRPVVHQQAGRRWFSRRRRQGSLLNQADLSTSLAGFDLADPVEYLLK